MTTMKRALLALALPLAAVAAANAAAAPTTPAPDSSTGQATKVAIHTATLTGTVNPHGSVTTYTFQFGPTSAYGAETKPASAGAGSTPVPVSASLSGLEAGTTYHYRLVATNADGQSTKGVDHTFTTQGRVSRLHLFGHTAFVSRHRVVGVFTGCLGDRPCVGSLRWTANGTVIGSRSFFAIKPNGGGIIHVTMNSAGRRLLARVNGRHFSTRVTVSSHDAGSDSKSVTIVPFR
jgi:hypothetical protein